jgi:hypothetical protein
MGIENASHKHHIRVALLNFHCSKVARLVANVLAFALRGPYNVPSVVTDIEKASRKCRICTANVDYYDVCNDFSNHLQVHRFCCRYGICVFLMDEFFYDVL